MRPVSDPRFEPTEPLYNMPDGLVATCGYVTVPEDHSRPDGPTIRLYVAVFRSHSEEPTKVPVVWLSGGPGCSMDGFLSKIGDGRGDLFLSRGDLVVFDQRGTGRSQPGLHCPELDSFVVDMALEGLTASQRAQRYVERALRCRERLMAEGVNLEAYNTVQNAADLTVVREVLGYEQIKLYGISYGSRLALAVMRDHPEILHSVVLDSVVPMEVCQPAEAVANFAHALNLLFRDCAANPVSNAAYPDLRTILRQGVQRLNSAPARVSIRHPSNDKQVSVLINGEALTGLIYSAFYNHARILTLPWLIYAIHEGNHQALAPLVQEKLWDSDDPSQSMGMYFSVSCCDDKVGPETAKAMVAADRAYPDVGPLPYTEFQLGEHLIRLCEQWGGRQPGRAEQQAVVSDIPTLVLAGEYDPDTPAAWSRLTAEKLSNSFFFEFPGAGHGVIDAHPSVLAIIGKFLDDPTHRPDEHGIAKMTAPEFVLPEQMADAQLHSDSTGRCVNIHT